MARRNRDALLQVLRHASQCRRKAPTIFCQDWGNLGLVTNFHFDREPHWRCIVVAKLGVVPSWGVDLEEHQLRWKNAVVALLNTRFLRKMLDEGMSPDIKIHRGCSLLQRACSCPTGNLPAVELLLERKATPQRDDLHAAVLSGQLTVVRMVLNRTSLRNGSLNKPVETAAAAGHLGVTELLVRTGSSQGLRPLEFQGLARAALCGHRAVVQLFLDISAEEAGLCGSAGESKQSLRRGGQRKAQSPAPRGGKLNLNSPLWSASAEGHLAIAHVLLGARAEMDRVDDFCNTTPLMAAASWGHVEVARLLLESRADPTLTKTATRHTALEIARIREQWPVVELLQVVTAPALEQLQIVQPQTAIALKQLQIVQPQTNPLGVSCANEAEAALDLWLLTDRSVMATAASGNVAAEWHRCFTLLGWLP